MRLRATRLATVFAASCLALAQSTDITYIPGIDLSMYHVYKWVAVQGPKHPDPSEDLRIKALIDSQLAARGFVKDEARQDLDIDYHIALSKAVPWDPHKDFELRDVPKQEMFTIDKVTIELDMYETESRKLVWTGRAERYIDPKGGADQMRMRVEKAVEAMLAYFPPN